MSDSPDLRIGDAEREDALRALGEHMAAGRLSVDEYGERSATVAAGKTQGDLLAVFGDLPDPRPKLVRQTTPPPHFAPPPPMPPPMPPPRVRGPIPVLFAVLSVLALVFVFRGAAPFLIIPAAILFAHAMRRPRRWH